eukprot:TRINITY_DN23148_c0_g1_i1.p1 TRINITY_DN23148_c0_g1~~TRINITY_DN23148_c0_g1_i1.p1  ORF type:complete len:1388 (-),score=146.43 TRINITY_DN23148_c0_g1_i1:138-4301(-)
MASRASAPIRVHSLGSSESPLLGDRRYGGTPKQARFDVYKVLLKKHVVLAWRRRRVIGVICRVLPCVIFPVLIMRLASADQLEMVRSSAATQVCPLFGTMMVNLVMSQFVIEVVADKEVKMKYVQEVAGVSTTAYWVSYYLYYFVLSSFAASVYVLSTTAFVDIYKYTNAGLICAVFALAFLQSFFVIIMISTVLQRPRVAAVVCLILGAIVICVSQSLLELVHSSSSFFFISLVPLAGPFSLLQAIGELEAIKVGFTLHSWDSVVANDSQVPAAGVQFFTLVVGCVLYGFLAAWFDQVYQGEYGVAKPWNFCFKYAFVCSRGRTGIVDGEQGVALKLEGLVKEFRTKQGVHRAVDGMSFEVARAEIFALLGHNGAGKTTAINCIIGMVPITEGSVKVCGVDVTTQLQEARRHLSVCPQDNPLYLEFSCDDHLQFFAALRGVPAERAKLDINSALSALGLIEKRSARVGTLSGGQKRRLWVATSLLGATPVVFLDEPTSGMDPANRRNLWSLLVQMKSHGRCILFTTHYLDEADVLAEQKAILDKGKVQATGTSWELKRKFGTGYHLRVVCEHDCSAAVQGEILAVLKRHVENAQHEPVAGEERSLRADAPRQWSFVLPHSDVHKFGHMLQELETRAQTMTIRDFALEATTLEEVFMALGQTRANVNVLNMAEQPVVVPHGHDPCAPPPFNLAGQDVRVVVTWTSCFIAVFSLRLRQICQAKKSLGATLVVPICFILYIGWSTQQQTGDDALPGLAAGLPLSICFAIAMPYFATTLVADRIQRCTYVATSQGLPLSAYWAGTFANNYLQNLILCVLVLLTFTFFDIPYFGEFDQIMKMLPATLLTPVPMLLFAYNTSRCFNTSEACAKFMPGIALLASLVPFFAVMIFTSLGFAFQVQAAFASPVDTLQLELGLTFHAWATALHWLFSFADPFYCLVGTFAALGSSPMIERVSALPGSERVDVSFPKLFGSYILVPFLGQLSLSLILSAVLLFDAERCGGLVKRWIWKAAGQAQSLHHDDQFELDADVVSEEKRVATTDHSLQAVLYQNLFHTYAPGSAREVRAVRGISLAVSRGECFTLLGPNGAGKTTTLDVLTGGIFPPTSGEVSINGYSITSSVEDRLRALQCLGNCPQVDPLWPALTGRQHLRFYARVKGLPRPRQEDQIDGLLTALGFSKFDADKPSQGYSGGMKRKLSLAIALIGSPPTLLLDEPSAAVDAAAKRHLWRVVKHRSHDQTVILTTHSMEEAEALSDRLAIQVKGKLRCIGTPDHIKNTHGSGYQLEVICGQIEGQSQQDFEASPSPEVVAFVRGFCPSARLSEYHVGRYLFRLSVLKAVGARSEELSVAKLFIHMQKAGKFGVKDYSISRPSLEQVFLRFAKEQQAVEAEL